LHQQPHARSFETPSEPTSFLAVLFAFLGVSDLVAASSNEEIAIFYWGNQAPIRLMFFFALTAFSYVANASGSAGLAGLKNNVVFTWGFIETVTWFWIFTSLRDEKRETLRRAQEKKAAEEDSL
jgi:Increased loss of mitochondrial DNA protein 1